QEDEIIGWIYQYYNEEARREFKKAGRKPTADDIPVINQFYTPHWVVRVLTDNTLGRLWLEMQGRCPYITSNPDNADGGSKIVESRIGLPNPKDSETFQNWLQNPNGETVDTFCSYFVPLKNEPPLREKKSVRDIKLLDPACGSGHFLVYAFDVLYRMYREDEPGTAESDIPGLVLEHNLFGIDIDLRAVQLAALALYLKAKSYNPDIKVKKLNLVVADARIIDGERRDNFLRQFDEDLPLKKLCAKLLEDLRNTMDIGSLYRLREHFKPYFEDRKEKLRQAEQASLPGLASDSEQLVLEGIVPQKRTLEKIWEAFHQFEREAMERKDMGSMLFATEAEKSVGLLTSITQKYDVVLMNPPYGSMSKKAKEYCRSQFPTTANDVYACFIEQAFDVTAISGFIGMLTSSSFMNLGTFETLRRDIILDKCAPVMLLDCGIGVLDGAIVRTAATILHCSTSSNRHLTPAHRNMCTFFRLIDVETGKKELVFQDLLSEPETKRSRETIMDVNDFNLVPTSPFIYWGSKKLFKLFSKHAPLDVDLAERSHGKRIASLKSGLTTGDDKRFLRLTWEVDSESIGVSKKWVPRPLGLYEIFYSVSDLLVNWNDNGQEIKEHPQSYVRNESFYFLPGLTWARTSEHAPGIRLLPPGCIIGDRTPLISPAVPLWGLTALLNSSLLSYLLLYFSHPRHWEVGHL
ncbi:hypothetical protein HKBW3S42_01167, partial [Candidatus Hakubella thermalkaliphila]